MAGLVILMHMAHHASGIAEGESDISSTVRRRYINDIRDSHLREDLALEMLDPGEDY